MSEPDLIRNNSPHQVTLAEGTNVAVGKKADGAETSVRKVLAEEEGIVIEHSLQDDFVALPEAVLDTSEVVQPTFDRTLKEAMALVPASVAKSDHMALVPEALPVPSAVVFVLEAPLAASLAQGPVMASPQADHVVDFAPAAPEPIRQPSPPEAIRMDSADTESPALSEALETMLQMNFPARVINLKIENDKVRTKLDSLQSSIRN